VAAQDWGATRGAGVGDLTASWWVVLARRCVRLPRDLALGTLDAVLVVAAVTFMFIVRYELAVPEGAWAGLLRFAPVAIVLQLTANHLAGLYGPVWEQASIIEAKRILGAGASATSVLFLWMLAGSRLVPLSVVITGGLVATGLMGVLRFQSRLFAFSRRHHDDALRTLVVGAGESGGALLREISRNPGGGIHVVALLDDDPRKIGRRVGNTRIVGGIDGLVGTGRRLDVDQVLMAIPSADSALVRRIADATAELGVPLKVLPSVSELLNGEPQLRDVRDLSIDDLLGRQPVSTDLESVAEMIRGRRVLVTGGGGSIGSEIVRQVAEYAPARLVVLDRDETHLFDSMAAIGERGEAVLLDIRDRDGLRELLHHERPEIVFHAAANKHVPLLESHAGEAASTNVLGTANLVEAARDAGVAHLVFVSTDKAVHPTSVMGASKRIGEHLVLSGAPADSAWCAVRFGNVLGSRGSVVPTFMRQIREGGPVTLTHPDMTRYFMSIPEAVQLVLQASAMAHGREVFMLDMGEPVRISDLATRMIALAGYRVGTDVAIEVTGLRPGEKLVEELHTPDEHPSGTSHPKVTRLRPRVPAAAALEGLLRELAAAVRCRDEARARGLLLDGLDGDPGAEVATVIRLSEFEATRIAVAAGDGLIHATREA
jgi:FlaA1/EpsC-like NDP-sugar epimerase